MSPLWKTSLSFICASVETSASRDITTRRHLSTITMWQQFRQYIRLLIQTSFSRIQRSFWKTITRMPDWTWPSLRRDRAGMKRVCHTWILEKYHMISNNLFTTSSNCHVEGWRSHKNTHCETDMQFVFGHMRSPSVPLFELSRQGMDASSISQLQQQACLESLRVIGSRSHWIIIRIEWRTSMSWYRRYWDFEKYLAETKKGSEGKVQNFFSNLL